ncbi:MAG: hypothetical protein GXO27_01500 [Chlorobi bacterium]|nr:hypothetical protein [Chlorobiota bacterium]
MKLNVITKITSILFLALAVFSLVMYYAIFKYGTEADRQIDILLTLTVWLLYIAAFMAILGWILDIIMDRRSLVHTLVAFAAFGLIVFVARQFADKSEYVLKDTVYSADTMVWVDTGLWTFYFLAGISIILMIFSWIYDFFTD